jgi:pimeloyl-ACP methyl ester carboxylesterase
MMNVRTVFARFGWIGIVLALLAFPVVHIVGAPRATAPAAPRAAQATTAQRARPGELEIRYLSVEAIKPQAPGRMRVGIMTPANPRADILFIHGHADRLDNHGPLFAAWNAAGYRVISFDLPSHGESNILPIDLYSFDDFFALVRLVDAATLEDPQRPLLLAAWSFGGLVATRLVQQPEQLATLSRPLSGLILLAPAVAPYPFPGGDGISRLRTLSNNPHPPVAGPPSPASPLQDPVFAARLLAEAWLAQRAPLPQHLPVLVLTAGTTEDWYVNTSGVLAWAEQQQRGGVQIHTFQCPKARHALDHEPYPIGPTVRLLAADFVTIALGDTLPARTGQAAQTLAQRACNPQ